MTLAGGDALELESDGDGSHTCSRIPSDTGSRMAPALGVW
jgi:hypothetical protein